MVWDIVGTNTILARQKAIGKTKGCLRPWWRTREKVWRGERTRTEKAMERDFE
jgi:hypothetical protein